MLMTMAIEAWVEEHRQHVADQGHHQALEDKAGRGRWTPGPPIAGIDDCTRWT